MNCTAKQRRRAAWTLLVGFLLAILVSLTFCAEEVDHDCTGADCAICAQLKLCKNILHAGKMVQGRSFGHPRRILCWQLCCRFALRFC